MEIVKAFIPLMAFWLLLLAVSTICTLVITAYRKRGLPNLNPVLAMVGSAAVFYYATLQAGDAVLMGLLLFGSGFAAFSGSAWSLQAMKEAGNQSVEKC